MDWITELKRQVEELEAKNERLRVICDDLVANTQEYATEVERLRTALREIADDQYPERFDRDKIYRTAREALNGEKQRGHVQSGEDEFGKTGRNEPEKP